MLRQIVRDLGPPTDIEDGLRVTELASIRSSFEGHIRNGDIVAAQESLIKYEGIKESRRPFMRAYRIRLLEALSTSISNRFDELENKETSRERAEKFIQSVALKLIDQVFDGKV